MKFSDILKQRKVRGAIPQKRTFFCRSTVETATVFVLIVVVLLIASKEIGLTWDESIYFQFSDRIRTWFLDGPSFTEEAVKDAWAYSPYHNPHPPFMKIPNAFTSYWFSEWLEFPANYRLWSIVYVAACLALIYRLLVSSYSSAMSCIAVCCICLQPRVFGHLIIAATDGPVAMAWVVLPLLAWRIHETDTRTKRNLLRLLFFVIYGFASATKFTGFLVVIPLMAYCLFHKQYKECLWLIGSGIYAVGFIILISPDMWGHPFAHAAQFLIYPFTRPTIIKISTFYLGTSYPLYLPWHYFGVMSFVTYPVVLWAVMGGLIYLRRIERTVLSPVLFCLGFWLILVHLPITPKHDGVRQFLSVYPLLALCSWAGLLGILARINKEISSPNIRYFKKGLVLCVLGVLGTGVWQCHPFELSYYNAFIGGIQGAERAGMEMTYWLDSGNRDFIRALDEYLVDGAKLYIAPHWPLVLQSYSQHGILHGTFTFLAPTVPAKYADYVILFRRRAVVDDESEYIPFPALTEVTYDGVSLAKFIRGDSAHE